jgi:hypothetical protein
MPTPFLNALIQLLDRLLPWLERADRKDVAHRAQQRLLCVDLAELLDELSDGFTQQTADVYTLCARLRTVFLSEQAEKILKNHPDRSVLQDVLQSAVYARQQAMWQVEQLQGPLTPDDPRIRELRGLAVSFRQHGALLREG